MTFCCSSCGCTVRSYVNACHTDAVCVWHCMHGALHARAHTGSCNAVACHGACRGVRVRIAAAGVATKSTPCYSMHSCTCSQLVEPPSSQSQATGGARVYTHTVCGHHDASGGGSGSGTAALPALTGSPTGESPYVWPAGMPSQCRRMCVPPLAVTVALHVSPRVRTITGVCARSLCRQVPGQQLVVPPS